MKANWLLPLIFFAQISHGQMLPNRQSLELMLAKEQYSQAIAAIKLHRDDATHPMWFEMHAQACIGLQDYQQAETILAQAITRFPQSAELYYVDAMNKFALAENSGLFSVTRYIKSGLGQLQRAIKLAPDREDWKLKLLGFYLTAPSMLGGDRALGRQLVADLQSATAETAAIAQSMLHSSTDQLAKAIQIIDLQLERSPAHVGLLVQKASLLRNQPQESAAIPLYQQAAALTDKPAAKHQYLYQVGRISASTQQQSDLAKQALQQVIDFYQQSEGQTLHWARLQLAQLYFNELNFDASQQLLKALTALKNPESKLAAKIKDLQKQLKKQQQGLRS